MEGGETTRAWDLFGNWLIIVGKYIRAATSWAETQIQLFSWELQLAKSFFRISKLLLISLFRANRFFFQIIHHSTSENASSTVPPLQISRFLFSLGIAEKIRRTRECEREFRLHYVNLNRIIVCSNGRAVDTLELGWRYISQGSFFLYYASIYRLIPRSRKIDGRKRRKYIKKENRCT